MVSHYQSGSGGASGSGNFKRPPVPFPGLDLHEVLGRGSYGRVFRGTYDGVPVAVKVCLRVSLCPGMPCSCKATPHDHGC